MASSKIREKILNAKDIGEKLVEIPEWGVTVKVKGLTGAQRARLFTSNSASPSAADIERVYVDLVILTTYDPETDEPIFQPADRDMLSQKSGAALDKIVQTALELSGLAPGSLRAAEKN